MAEISEEKSAPSPEAPGLRGQKKARRRREILNCARQLLERDGVDATTMTAIAGGAGISPPTVFNYFGSKENIIVALLFEGTEEVRNQHLNSPRKTNLPFAEVLGDLLCECTQNTMKIAGKRVWRYAEAANIRRPDTEFQMQFAYSDAELLKLFQVFLDDYDMKLRNGKHPDPHFLGNLFYDRWTARYFEFIKKDDMSLAEHLFLVRSDVAKMIELLFEDDFAAKSPLKYTDVAK